MLSFLLLKGNSFCQGVQLDTVGKPYCSSYLDTALNLQVYDFADQKAEFFGGESALFKFIYKHLEYPKGLYVNGTVYVEVVIGEDGVMLRRSLRNSLHLDLDKEALRIMDLISLWVPAICNGKVVPFSLTIPIKFFPA